MADTTDPVVTPSPVAPTLEDLLAVVEDAKASLAADKDASAAADASLAAATKAAADAAAKVVASHDSLKAAVTTLEAALDATL